MPQAFSRVIPAAERPNPAVSLRKSRRLNRSTFVDARYFIVVLLSSLQLCLEFIKKTPVSALSNNVIRTLLDHLYFMETQGIEAHSILRIILPPFVERGRLHEFERVIVVLGEALVHHELGCPLRLAGAEISCSQNPTQRSFGCYGILLHELPVSS